MDSRLPVRRGTNWGPAGQRPMAGVSQESGVLGTVCHQAPVTPIASDLMSSPLRKRIRSPDLREALSAGLPGSKERGCGQLSSDPLRDPCVVLLFYRREVGRVAEESQIQASSPTLEPAPLCSQLLEARSDSLARVGVLGTRRGPLVSPELGEESRKGRCAHPQTTLLYTLFSTPRTKVHNINSSVPLSLGENVSRGSLLPQAGKHEELIMFRHLGTLLTLEGLSL